MSLLDIPKNYVDGELLYHADLTAMWSAVETKVNVTKLDSDNIQSGFATNGDVTYRDDVKLYFGDSSTAYLMGESTGDLHVVSTANADIILKINNAEVGRFDSATLDLQVPGVAYFAARSTTYPINRILSAYQKPVLVWQATDSVSVENNTTIANETLIMFPTGPIAVTENIGSTHKFRKLLTTATANGYDSAHTGAADSGIRSGLALAANTWYYTYAVRVRYGSDAGNNFILVLDDTSPVQANEATLNTRYGTSEWVYLGCVRRGYGASSTSTTAICKFQMTHQGWTVVYANDTNDLAGIEIYRANITSAAGDATAWTLAIGNSGTSVPAVIDSIQVGWSLADDDDATIHGHAYWTDASSNKCMILPQQQNAFSTDGGYTWKMPVVSGHLIVVGTSGGSNDADHGILLQGWCDFYI